MQKINNDISLSTVISKQKSPVDLLAQEKFSSFLNDEPSSEEEQENQRNSDLDEYQQTLQNQAHLNKLFLESVA